MSVKYFVSCALERVTALAPLAPTKVMTNVMTVVATKTAMLKMGVRAPTKRARESIPTQSPQVSLPGASYISATGRDPQRGTSAFRQLAQRHRRTPVQTSVSTSSSA
jgi:hypothetical protein